MRLTLLFSSVFMLKMKTCKLFSRNCKFDEPIVFFFHIKKSCETTRMRIKACNLPSWMSRHASLREDVVHTRGRLLPFGFNTRGARRGLRGVVLRRSAELVRPLCVLVWSVKRYMIHIDT